LLKYDPALPDELLRRDQLVKGDYEPGDYAFGHELVLVPDDQIVGFIPVVDRLVLTEALRSDVAFTVGNLVTELEVDHQTQQFILHDRVFRFTPYLL
jgi:hypothetical protein